MTVTPITNINAYVPIPAKSVSYEEGTGVAFVTVTTDSPKQNPKQENNHLNKPIESSAELLSNITSRYSYKSPIAKIQESINQSQKSKETKSESVNEDEKSELNSDSEGYTIQEVFNKKINKGYFITMPKEYLIKYGEKNKIDEATFTLKATYDPSLITRNGSLVNLTL